MTPSSAELPAAEVIARLGLAPHPEGGWYRQTWRAPAPGGERPVASAIHFLLDAGERSHWHAVDAGELWLWHAGVPVTLSLAPSASGPIAEIVLGADLRAGERPQAIVPAGHWQAAAPRGDGWALVSCVVAPAFDFAGFVLAAPDWAPGGG